MCCGRFTSGVPCAYIYIQVHMYRYVYTGTYIQVQIVRFIVLWQMSQLMICLSKMKLVTGILAASITTLEIKLVCFIHINNVNVLHLSKISKCHRRGD